MLPWDAWPRVTRPGLHVTFSKQIPDEREPRGAAAARTMAPWRVALNYMPGLVLCAAIAAASLGIRFIPGARPCQPDGHRFWHGH